MARRRRSKRRVTVGLCLEGGNDYEAMSEILARLSESHDITILARTHRGYADLVKSVSRSIQDLIHDGASLVVILADNDRKPPSERINELRTKCVAVPMDQDLLAIAIAVQALEAWLLSDEAALSFVSGRTIQAIGHPYAVDYPDKVFKDVIGFESSRKKYADLMRAVASILNLEVVAGKCRSFRRFRQDYTGALRRSGV